MADDTDGDVLTMLRGDAHCPADVLTLATEAAAKGLLVVAFDRAWDGMMPDMIGSSNSSNTIHPARVPNPDSMLPNV